jgi:hypothetical protein
VSVRRVPINAVGLAIQASIRAQATAGMTVLPKVIQVADYYFIRSQLAELIARLPAVVITPNSGDFQTSAPNGAFLPALGQAQLWWINYLWPLDTPDATQGQVALAELIEMFTGSDHYDEAIVVDGVVLEYAIPGSWEFSDDYAAEKLGHAKFGLVVSFHSDLPDE